MGVVVVIGQFGYLEYQNGSLNNSGDAATDTIYTFRAVKAS